jgi:hypothetical protein
MVFVGEVRWGRRSSSFVVWSRQPAAGSASPDHAIHGGADATAVVLDSDSDAYLVGGKQVIDTLRSTNPKRDTLLVSSMVSMCAQMMASAIVAILVTWFAIRGGQAWGLWAVTAAALAQVPYYWAVISMYAAQGAPLGGAVGLVPYLVGPLIARPGSGRDATDAALSRQLTGSGGRKEEGC